MVPRLKMPVIGLPRPAGSAAVASHVGLRRDPRVPPRLLPTHAAVPVAQQFDSEKLPQTLVSEIRPSLRAANQVEAENPRVADLCECPHDRALPASRTFSSSVSYRRELWRPPTVRGNAQQRKLAGCLTFA